MTTKRLSLLLALILALGCLISAAAAEGGETVFFYEEDTAVYDVIAHQGALYILKTEGIARYDPSALREEPYTGSVTGDWGSPAHADCLLSDGERLYAADYSEGVLYAIGEDGARQEAARFEAAGYPSASFLQEGTLYLLVTEPNAQTLVAVSLDGSGQRSLKVRDVEQIVAYRDGQSLAVTAARRNGETAYALCALDLTSGETTAFAELEERPSALAYDRDADAIYLADRQQLCRWSPEGPRTPSATLISGDLIKVALFGDGLCAAIVDNSLAIRRVQEGQARRVLTIRSPYGRTADYQAFVRAYPDVDLVFCGSPSMTAEEEFISDMNLRSGATDVYLLSDLSLLNRIHEKGFSVDLSSSALLDDAARDMYPAFRDALMRGDRINAFPQRAFVTMPGYDQSLFEAFGLPVPATYDELFALVEQWLDEYADDHPEVYFNPFDAVDLPAILTCHTDAAWQNDEALNYDDPRLAQTVEAYLRARQRIDAAQSDGPYEAYAFNLLDVPYAGPYAYLPLAMEQERSPIVSSRQIEMAYFVSNPYSEHQEEALRFIESSLADWPDEMRLVLLRSSAQPVEEPGWAQEHERLSTELAELDRRLAGSAEEDRAELQAQRMDIAYQLADCEASRYAVTQEEIDWYQDLAATIVISPTNPIPTLEDTQPELFSRLQSGQMTAQQFLAQLSERARSILLETE